MCLGYFYRSSATACSLEYVLLYLAVVLGHPFFEEIGQLHQPMTLDQWVNQLIVFVDYIIVLTQDYDIAGSFQKHRQFGSGSRLEPPAPPVPTHKGM